MKPSQEEALRRVKLSIDRQKSGEIDSYFGDGGNLQLMVCASEGGWLVIARNQCGDFAIDESGDCEIAHLERVN